MQSSIGALTALKSKSRPVSFSPIAQHLFQRLVESDPQKRLTSKEALQHPWITGDSTFIMEIRDSDARVDREAEEKVKLALRSLMIVNFLMLKQGSVSLHNKSQSQIVIRGQELEPRKMVRNPLYLSKCRTVRKQIPRGVLQGPERMILIRSRVYNKNIEGKDAPVVLSATCQMRPKSSANTLCSDATLEVLGIHQNSNFKSSQINADLLPKRTRIDNSQERMSVPLDLSSKLEKRKTSKKVYQVAFEGKIAEGGPLDDNIDQKRVLAMLFPNIDRAMKDSNKQAIELPSPTIEVKPTKKSVCLSMNRRFLEVGRSLPSINRVHP